MQNMFVYSDAGTDPVLHDCRLTLNTLQCVSCKEECVNQRSVPSMFQKAQICLSRWMSSFPKFLSGKNSFVLIQLPLPSASALNAKLVYGEDRQTLTSEN